MGRPWLRKTSASYLSNQAHVKEPLGHAGACFTPRESPTKGDTKGGLLSSNTRRCNRSHDHSKLLIRALGPGTSAPASSPSPSPSSSSSQLHASKLYEKSSRHPINPHLHFSFEKRTHRHRISLPAAVPAATCYHA